MDFKYVLLIYFLEEEVFQVANPFFDEQKFEFLMELENWAYGLKYEIDECGSILRCNEFN